MKPQDDRRPNMTTDRTGRAQPLTILAAALVGGGLLAMLRPVVFPAEQAHQECILGADGECVQGLPASSSRRFPTGPGPVLDADDVCADAGYLCADLATTDRIVIQRWRGFSGTIVVHVPAPPMRDKEAARRLQRAAAAGIRQWNGQPFPIVADERGTRQAHFSVQWAQHLGGNRIGIASTRWIPTSGLEVRGIQLAWRSPNGTSDATRPRQIRLTAAHEMGHALGLPHSDAPHDVMYPTNTASSLSAQDYVSMEALYRFEDGTEIVR